VSSALAQQKDPVPRATINGSQSEISPFQENSKKIRAADTNYKDDSMDIEIQSTSQTSSVLERLRAGNEDLANLPSMRNSEIYSSAGIIYCYFALYLF
jgi:hypothetical protein